MNRTQRIAVTAVTATGLLGGAGVALGLAPGLQASPTTQLASDVTPDNANSPELQSLQDSIAKLEDESASLQSDLAKAQKQLALAEKARLKAAQDAASAQAAANAPAKVTVRRQAHTPPTRHTTTGASGSGGEHESEHDD